MPAQNHLIIVFMLIINILPPEKNVETSPFVVVDGQLPFIAAHRGGSANNPENTLLRSPLYVWILGESFPPIR